jgi:L-asparaginase/Glu-tRNA(Gln) amidotransferase subunit D
MTKDTSTQRVMLIYTGGTIGMIRNPETGALETFNFEHLRKHVPELNNFDYTIDSYQFDPPIDSSDMEPPLWVKLVHIIDDNYDSYDGFVILHGTDTMAYTASALSFMLENLSKPVILTGSQLPIGVLRTDGKENLMFCKGIWIWENTCPQTDEYADFIDTFSYNGGTVDLRISADSDYAVFVNGQLAAFGQYHDFPHCKVADTHDITPFCRQGSNDITIIVWYYGIASSVYLPGKAGLFYEITAGDAIIAASGTQTFCRRDPLAPGSSHRI